MKKEKRFPVLFITAEMAEQETYSILNRLLKNQFIEKLKCRKTVLIWDKNTYEHDEVYEEMKRDLVECNVVIVGSRYFVESRGYNFNKKKNNTSPVVITLSENLSPETELPALKETLSGISPLYEENLDSILDKAKNLEKQVKERQRSYISISLNDDANWFFIIMYRLFEQIHVQQQLGVARESKKAREKLEILLEEYNYDRYATGVFGKLLGLLESTTIKSDTSDPNKAGKILNMIAVVSKFGIVLPIMILLRAFGDNTDDNVKFIKQMSRNSMIRVNMNENGIMLISFRHLLEASLYLQWQFSSSEELQEKEIEYLIDVINNTNFYNGEAWIIISLLRKFGPNGPEKSKYKRFYVQIADALKDNNNSHNVEAILIRCHLLREAFDYNDESEERARRLQEARPTLRKTIANLGSNDKSRKMARLKVELSSNLVRSLPVKAAFTKEEREMFWEINELLSDARKIDFSAHSIEVFLNAALKMYNNESDKELKKYLISQMVQLVDDVSDFHPEYMDQDSLQNKVIQVREINNNHEETEVEYRALIERGSDTGIYLKAMRVLDDYALNENLTFETSERVKKALGILGEHKKIIEKKPRSLFLNIRLLWLEKTGAPFYSEKQCTRLSEKDWYELNRLCTLYTHLEEHSYIALPYFIQAVYQFIYGSDNSFRKLLKETRKKECRSPAKHYTYIMWCNEMGVPRTIDAVLKSRHTGNASFVAELSEGKHFGTSAYFTESNFKNMLCFENNMPLGKVNVGLSLYNVVVYEAEEYKKGGDLRK